MPKFLEFSNFLETPHFRVGAPGNSLLGTIFSIGRNLAERRGVDDDRLKWSILRQVGVFSRRALCFQRLDFGIYAIFTWIFGFAAKSKPDLSP